MRRLATLLYGASCYALFLGVFVYAALFVGGLGVPTTLDGPRQVPLGLGFTINMLLVLAFAVQHSVMARPGFKRWVSRWLAASAERSTYVLCSSLALAMLFWQWQPLGGVIWDVQQPALSSTLWELFASGWLLVLFTTFLINHFDLFGLQQHFQKSNRLATNNSSDKETVQAWHVSKSFGRNMPGSSRTKCTVNEAKPLPQDPPQDLLPKENNSMAYPGLTDYYSCR